MKPNPLVALYHFTVPSSSTVGAIRRRICRSFRPRPPRLLLRCGAGIHTKDLRHLRPLRSGPGTHLKRRAGGHAAEAAALDYADMQERVASTVGKLYEAEALVRVVPLDGRSDRRTGGAVELWTARRRISEITDRRFIVVVVETTAAGLAKIPLSIAHVGILGQANEPYFEVPASDRQRASPTIAGAEGGGLRVPL